MPDDRPIYDKPTVFWPRCDVDNSEITNTFEREGSRRGVHRVTSGTDIYGKPGDHVDGDDEDFLGAALRAKHFVDGVQPLDPCPSTFGPFIRLAVRVATHVCTAAELLAANPTVDLFLGSSDEPLWPGVTIPMFGFALGGGAEWSGTIFLGTEEWHGQVVATNNSAGYVTLSVSGGLSDVSNLQSAVGLVAPNVDCHHLRYLSVVPIRNVITGLPTGTHARLSLGTDFGSNSPVALRFAFRVVVV